MAITTACTACGKQVRVADEHAGKTIKCPGCKSPLTLPGAAGPSASQTLAVVCSSCNKGLRVPAKYAGKRVKCPNCNQPIDVLPSPKRSSVPPVAAPAAKAPPPQRAPLAPADWHVLSHDGNQYGPIAKSELDGWVTEGLLSPACQVRSGNAPWQPACQLYPQLASEAASAPAGGAPQFAEGYEPVLTLIKSNASSMASTYLHSSLGGIGRGNAIVRSETYQFGEARSFWERVKAGTIIGPLPKKSEIHIDQVHLMTVSDPSGEVHVIAPYDNGALCPVEFVSVMPGYLPTSLGLMRGQGGNWGVEAANSVAGAFVPSILRSAMREVGGQASALWVVLDEDEPQTAAEVANQFPDLAANLRFDATVKMGPMEVTYHLDWAAQALPMGGEEYLLAARFIPVNKALGMLGFDVGLAWFLHWRDQFLAMADHLPTEGEGYFCCYDHSIWGTVAYEVLGLDVF